MKKLSLFAGVALSLLSFTAQAQEKNLPAATDFSNPHLISTTDWKIVIDQLRAEKWMEAEKTATAFLVRAEKDTAHPENAAILRYMIINAIAGELASNQTDNETANNKLKKLNGQTVITPTYTFKSKALVNGITLTDDAKGWSQIVTNRAQDAVMIKETYSLIYPSMAQDAYDKYENNNFRLQAKITAVSATSIAHPHVDISLSNAEIWDISEPAK